MKNTTVGELSRYKEQNKYRAIREIGSNYHKKVFNGVRSCKACGYGLHVEHCHIKPIKDFDDNDSVWDCNKLENIVLLCRNCHWELDNGFSKIEDII